MQNLVRYYKGIHLLFVNHKIAKNIMEEVGRQYGLKLLGQLVQKLPMGMNTFVWLSIISQSG